MKGVRVDIDGTVIFTHVEEGRYIVDDVNIALIMKLRKMKEEGYRIIMDTGRHWNHYDDTVKQLKDAGVDYDELIMGKPPVDYIIDDTAYKPEDFLMR